MIDQAEAVTVKFRLTQSEVFEALVRINIRTLWIGLLPPIIGAIAVVWAIVDPANGAVNLSSGFVCLAIGALVFGAIPYFTARMVMKAPNSGGLMTVTATGQGIEVTG